MAYDPHITEFESILKQAADLWQLVSPELEGEPRSLNLDVPPVPNFTVDMGFIPPIYYTAVKCRVPGIRRKAIDFLSAAPHREGIWDGAIVAQIASHIMEIEEESFRRSSGSNLSSDLFEDLESFADQPVVPESTRIHNISVLLPDSIKSKATLICRRPGVQKNGPWEIKTMEFDLVSGAISMSSISGCELRGDYLSLQQI